MSIFFTPNGRLNIAADPSDLQESGSGNNLASGEMTRCKNLILDRAGQAATRDGSTKLNATAIATPVHLLLEHAGYRYAFAGAAIYRDETSITSGLTSAAWAAIVYNAYNSTTEAIFALNGTDRKRIEGGSVYEWGIEAPTTAPTLGTGAGGNLSGQYNAKYTYVRKEGAAVVCESNPSPAATIATVLTGGSLTVDVSQPTDSQVTHIRLYRTLAGGTDYYYDREVAVNTSYAYGYVYDWEAEAHDGLLGVGYGYTYDWEPAYLEGDEYAFTVADGDYQHIYDWEDADGPTSGTDYEQHDTVAGWGAAQEGLLYLAGDGHKLTTEDTTNSREHLYDWEQTFTDRTAADANEGSYYSQPFAGFDSDTPDGALGTAVATNHDRPPLGTGVAGPAYNGTCFILKDNRVYYCLAKQPEYWPSTYYVEVGSREETCRKLVFHGGQPYVLTDRHIYHLQGTSANTFFPIPMAALTGTKSAQAVETVQGQGIYRPGNDGIYLFAGADKNITDTEFLPIFRGLATNGMAAVGDLSAAWLVRWRGRLYLAYAASIYEEPRYILRMDLESKKTVYFDYGRELVTAAVDETNDRLLAADSAGYVWVLEDATQTDDDGTAIAWELQSKDFLLQTRRHFPRYAKYDVDASAATSATGEILLDGSVHQSHTLAGSRSTKYRQVATGNGNRAALRISGSGPVKIYAAEME